MDRKDDKRRAVLLLGVEMLIVIALVGAILTTVAALTRAYGETFYDRNGSFAGTATKHGNSTSFTDRNGRFDGTAIRNSDGTTSFYDGRGRFTGSSTRAPGTNSNPITGGR